jgi:hypothetical protein
VANQFGLTQPVSDGIGYQHNLKATKPAAGANFTVTLSPNFYWRVQACVFTIVTDANAANRYITLQTTFGDGVANWVNGASVTVSANTTQRFAGSADRTIAEWNTNTDVFFPIDRSFLRDGVQLAINVQNIQVGDQLSAIYFTFDRFETNPHRIESTTVEGQPLQADQVVTLTF